MKYRQNSKNNKEQLDKFQQQAGKRSAGIGAIYRQNEPKSRTTRMRSKSVAAK